MILFIVELFANVPVFTLKPSSGQLISDVVSSEFDSILKGN